MMKKISIILPVYNGARYIERCIQSILNQKDIDLADVEILAFNDGSVDNSLEILKRYEKLYPDSINTYDQANIGVAETRNKGIDISTGEYILFIDQDDYIDEDYCKVLFDAIEDGGWDVVICGKKRPDNNGKIISRDIYEDADFTRYMSVSVWAKIHRARFLKDNNIRIFNNHQGEDIVFSFEESQKARKIKTIKYCGYNWFFNEKSVSNSSQRGLDSENLQSIMNVQNQLIKLDESKNNESVYFVTLMSAYYLFFAGKASTPSQFMEAYNKLFSNLRSSYKEYDKNRLIWHPPKGVLPVFATGVKVFMILDKLHLLPLFAKVYCRRRV